MKCIIIGTLYTVHIKQEYFSVIAKGYLACEDQGIIPVFLLQTLQEIPHQITENHSQTKLFIILSSISFQTARILFFFCIKPYAFIGKMSQK